MNLLRRLPSADAPAATVLIRLAVGSVFLSEGIQKFLDPLTRSAGRFARIGIPAADIMGPLVGATEVVCGLLMLVGLATRLAAPLVATMSVAVVSTKIPILDARCSSARCSWSSSVRALGRLIDGSRGVGGHDFA